MQEKKNNIPPLPADSSDTLLQAFDTLHDAILSMSCEMHRLNENGNLLAVVRLLNGISPAQWAQLAERYHLEHWVAVDLNSPSTQDLALLYKNMRELVTLKDNDPLTGLPTRETFLRNLQLELERIKCQSAELSVVNLDLDRFQQINEHYGHDAGDIVLQRLAEKLITAKRGFDTPARIGGGKFALLLPGAGMNRAKAIIQRMLNGFRLEKFTTANGEVFAASFSAGIASLAGSNLQNVEQLLEAAEKALAQAKGSGRNKVVGTQILIEDEIRRSMVHSDEKHFLFFGKHKK